MHISAYFEISDVERDFLSDLYHPPEGPFEEDAADWDPAWGSKPTAEELPGYWRPEPYPPQAWELEGLKDEDEPF